MSAERLIASHLRLAREALDGAGLLLDGGNRNAVYLAEQAVQQMILALAQAETIHFPRSAQHQLDTMIRSFPAENPVVAELLALSWLEAYATTFRYPRTHGGVTEPPPHEKLTDALKSLEALLAKLTGHFGVRLSVKDERLARASHLDEQALRPRPPLDAIGTAAASNGTRLPLR